MFTGMNQVLDRLERHDTGARVSSGGETTDTSGDESGGSQGRRRRPKKAYVLKRSHAESELASLFVTGATDASKKPGHFFVEYAIKTFRLQPRVPMRLDGISRVIVTLVKIKDTVWRPLGCKFSV